MYKTGLAISLAVVLSGCGGSGGDNPPDGFGSVVAPRQCTVTEQKQFVWDLLNDSYLWADQMPASIDLDNYQSAEDLLEQLKYAPHDSYSYITSKEEYDGFFESGEYIGLGYSSQLNEAEDGYQIRYVYQGSPAYLAGLRRGDLILAINDRPATEIAIALENNTQTWDDILGTKTIGVEAKLQWMTPDGETLTKNIVKDRLSSNTVHAPQVIDAAAGKVGYFAFTAFTEPSKVELATVFNQFSETGVAELILDLRYNGGGRVSTANRLSTEIAGSWVTNEIFTQYRHNNKYNHLDSAIPFETALSPLNLSRLIVLTTDESCSASEMTINALRPFIEVVTIGGTTCGKPVGMYNHEFCDQVILPIEFQVANARNEGEYFDGLTADCAAEDDPRYRWGDHNDNMLNEALTYLDSGSCSDNSNKASKAKPAARINAATGVVNGNPMRALF